MIVDNKLLRSVGPHGLTFVISNGAPKTRKFTWLIVTLGKFGFQSCAYNLWNKQDSADKL